jgi:hypothetical protein
MDIILIFQHAVHSDIYMRYNIAHGEGQDHERTKHTIIYDKS